jgi:hypothetical protein
VAVVIVYFNLELFLALLSLKQLTKECSVCLDVEDAQGWRWTMMMEKTDCHFRWVLIHCHNTFWPPNTVVHMSCHVFLQHHSQASFFRLCWDGKISWQWFLHFFIGRTAWRLRILCIDLAAEFLLNKSYFLKNFISATQQNSCCVCRFVPNWTDVLESFDHCTVAVSLLLLPVSVWFPYGRGGQTVDRCRFFFSKLLI